VQVEVIVGREATFQRYRQLLITARGEVLRPADSIGHRVG
jgi:hypothetical protein